MVVRSRFYSGKFTINRLASSDSGFSRWTIFKSLLKVGLPLLFVVFLHAKRTNHQTFVHTDKSKIGILQYLPAGYNENSDKYPLVIFLHGYYERGVSSTKPEILESTIDIVDKIGPPRNVRKGYEFPFILLSPQLKYKFERWPESYIQEVVEWAKLNLRVDEKQIHITGLSLGGGGTFSALQNFPDIFASGVPICAYWNSPEQAPDIAREDVAVWAFHGARDHQVPLHTSSYMIDSINRSAKGEVQKAILTIYPEERHAIWDKVYKADHSLHNPNIYEWMMSIKKDRVGDNLLPSAYAGDDKSAPRRSSVTLSGRADDPDGRIVSFTWRQLTGPSAVIDNPMQAETTVTLSGEGVYMFQLTAEDNGGSRDTDFVRVVVD